MRQRFRATGHPSRQSRSVRLPRWLRWYLPVLVLLLAMHALNERQWYVRAPEGNPLLGANFSCKRTEYLGLDCAAALAAVLDDLGARELRLSLYWSDVEQRPGQYDFSSIDWQLDAIAGRDARAVVTLGMKAQRYPEFWLPTWLRLAANIPPNALPEEHPLIEQHLFPFLAAATRHLSAHPAVEALQVENEPFVHYQGHANGWRIRREFLLREIATVRAADPRARPVVINHASWLRTDDSWQWILEHGDVLGQSVYTKRQRGPWRWLYIFPYRIGPITPYLPGQAREAARRQKQLWIGELQAEPFERPDVDERQERSSDLRSFSPRWLDENVRLARRSGATRAYLWGVEWWLYLGQQRDEWELWERGRRLFAPAETPDSGPREREQR